MEREGKVKSFKVVLLSILVVASLIAPVLALTRISEAIVYPTVDNIVLRGKDNMYSYNCNPPVPIKTYVQGDCPPIVMAQRIGSGAVVAGGFVTACRGTSISDDLASLMDAIFQWMGPGAHSVLWFNGYSVYCTSTLCSTLITKLTTKGYTVTGSAATPITSGMLAPYDFLVIPEMQLGSSSVGGDPSLLPDADVAAIKSFVEGGKGLLIMGGSDFYVGGNFFRVLNKILESLSFCAQGGMYFGFQSDSAYDDVNNLGGNNYSPIVDVDPAHPIGAAYQAATGKTTVVLYGSCSLTQIGPGISLEVIPQYEVGMPGDNLTWRVHVFNSGTEGYTVHLTVSSDSGWNPTFDSNDFALAAGENKTVIMSVIVPDGTPLPSCTDHEITITAATVEYPAVSANYTCIAHSGLRLEVTADAAVSDQNPDETLGTTHPNYLEVGRYTTFWEYTYLRWDNLDVIPSDATITDAKIYLFCWKAYGSTQDMLMCSLSNDTWDESTITWNTKPNPPYENILDTIAVSSGGEADPETYVWDVTSYVQQEFAGDQAASFCLRPADNCGESTNRVFESKEWWDSRLHPFLRIIYTSGTPPPTHGVTASISPSSKNGPPGSTLTYTVTVKNTGTASDTYSLTTADNAGWSRTISPASLPLAASASGTATLSVTVPENALEGTRDNIIVRATSTENTEVWAENSCIARAIAVTVRGVEVSISPDSQDNENGGTLMYTVTVTNTGTVTEDYDLAVDDDAGWTLTLPSSVTDVVPDEGRQVMLTVRIPATAANGASTTITVTATSSENTEVENSDTCVANCVITPTGQGVQVTISGESSKSGKPGDELSFTVVVTNTGTGTDTFSVTAEDTENWAPTVSPGLFSIGAGASRSATLRIIIPSTAADGASATITVTAAGTGYENSAICTATAQAGGGISPFVYVGAVVVIVVILGAVLIFIKPF
jgi:uncharacterized membrane protein